ncbi:MAG TPA: hypothetical protein VJT74_07025 [Pyrinomonadaceae bacterium]|nr:hypothetical protein [Pyrinomonadaceae bacterium]
MSLMLGLLGRAGKIAGPAAGFLGAFASAFLAALTIEGYREGFMYCGNNRRVYRKDDPGRFKFRLVVHILLVLGSAAVSVYGFLT